MISKTLFGTMDTDDTQVINEQLNLLRNNQKTIQHAVKNQLKILDTTIGHTDCLEKTLKYNENLQRYSKDGITVSKVRTAGRYHRTSINNNNNND